MLKQFIKGLAAMGLLAICATTAQAGLMFNMQLADGSKSITLASPGVVEVDLWVQMTGADTSRTNDKFIFGWGSVAHTGVSFAGGVVGGATGTDPYGLGTTDMSLGSNVIFQPFTGAGAQFGAVAPLTGAASDMGSNAANNYANYIKIGSDVPSPIASTGPAARALSNAGDANDYPAPVAITGANAGWKAMVGRFFINATGGVADWNWVPANFTDYQYSASVWVQDNVNTSNDGKTAAAIGTVTMGAPVHIELVPEPASLSLLALGALGLLARRRA